MHTINFLKLFLCDLSQGILYENQIYKMLWNVRKTLPVFFSVFVCLLVFACFCFCFFCCLLCLLLFFFLCYIYLCVYYLLQLMRSALWFILKISNVTSNANRNVPKKAIFLNCSKETRIQYYFKKPQYE